MSIPFSPTLVSACLALSGAAAYAADPFVAAGAKGTLTVDYLVEAAGKQQDKIDLREWRVKRTVSIVVDLAAQKAAGWPQLQAPDAAQVAESNQRAQRGVALAQQAAPMMASVEKIMAKCGDDEACIGRETQKMGFAMSGTADVAASQKMQQEAKALVKADVLRYQTWLSTAEKATYAIDEFTHIVHGDPICVSLPRARCTRDEQRKGDGTVPPGKGGGLGAVEFDAQKNTLSVRLPIPVNALAYTETITTDEPAGTHSTPTPKGPQPRQLVFLPRVGKADMMPLLTLPLRGASRSQSGEQAWPISSDGGQPAKLTVRWRFVPS